MVPLGAAQPRSGRIGILSRTNAPLLALRDCLAVRHVAVRFEGLQTLAKKLKHTLMKIGAKTFGELKNYLNVVSGSKMGYFCDDGEKSDGDDDPDPYAEQEPKTSTRVDARDMHACLEVIVKRLEYISKGAHVELAHLERHINGLFAKKEYLLPHEEERQVVLSTVHRAKGLEWDTVYLLQPGDLPLRHIMEWGSENDRRQERNVQYVAYTRARQKLVFLRHLNKNRDEPWSVAIEGLFSSLPPEEEASARPRQRPRQRPSSEDTYDEWSRHCKRPRGTDSANGAGGAPSTTPVASEIGTVDDWCTSLGLDDLPTTPAALASAYTRRILAVHPDKQMIRPAALRLSKEEAARLVQKVRSAHKFLKEHLDF